MPRLWDAQGNDLGYVEDDADRARAALAPSVEAIQDANPGGSWSAGTGGAPVYTTSTGETVPYPQQGPHTMGPVGAAAPTAPGAAPASPTPGAAGGAPPAATGGAYAPPAYTGSDAGDYGTWLRALAGYRAPETGTVGASASAADQLNAMLSATHAEHYLSPYYLAMLRSTLPKAQAGYAVSAALAPGSPDMPTQAGTGATESLGQYLQDQLIQRGNQGNGISGWGPYSSGVPLLGQFVAALDAAKAAPAGSAEAALWDKYNTTAGRTQLQNILGAGVEGPFASYRQARLNDDVFNPASTGTDNGAFLAQLRDWMHATYGV